MATEDIEQRLRSIFRGELDVDPLELRPETTNENVPGWDSVVHMNLIAATEETFGLKFTSREVEQLVSFGDFVRLVSSRVGGGAGS